MAWFWNNPEKDQSDETYVGGETDPRKPNFDKDAFFRKLDPVAYYHLNQKAPGRNAFLQDLKQKNYKDYRTFFPNSLPETALNSKHLKGIREWLADPEEEISPMTRAAYHVLLNHYGNGKVPTKFSHRYDRYFAPFAAGINNTTRKDMIEPQYLNSTPFDSQEEIMRKHRYNLDLNKRSTIDPFLTAASHGLGLVSAASGGLGGLVLGHAIKNGIPLMWHIAKQRLANQASRRSKWDNFYDSVKKSNSSL
jgi:hypothetical protein